MAPDGQSSQAQLQLFRFSQCIFTPIPVNTCFAVGKPGQPCLKRLRLGPPQKVAGEAPATVAEAGALQRPLQLGEVNQNGPAQGRLGRFARGSKTLEVTKSIIVILDIERIIKIDIEERKKVQACNS